MIDVLSAVAVTSLISSGRWNIDNVGDSHVVKIKIVKITGVTEILIIEMVEDVINRAAAGGHVVGELVVSVVLVVLADVVIVWHGCWRMAGAGRPAGCEGHPSLLTLGLIVIPAVELVMLVLSEL